MPAQRAPLPSGVRRRRLVLGLVGCLLALAAVLVLSLMVGANALPPSDVWHALWHYSPDDQASLIVVNSRLPRTLVGLLAGVALGLAGTVMQGLTRNPLADPGLLGVNAGASLAVVLGIAVFGVTSAAGYVPFAFVGAALASVAVYSVASLGREGATPVKLALAGAAVSAALGSLVTAVLLTDAQALDQLRFWEVGALAGRDMDVVRQVAVPIAVGAVVALALGRALNGLALGEDVARALGQRIGLVRVVAAVAIVLLCGSATAAAGPIAFVGLIVPHAARRVVGTDYRWILVFSAVFAPTLLVACDVIGRVVAYPGELQVGIVTAVVGAPLFIALVRRRGGVSL
ncbi:iron complex transport system permease protein [Luteimicrobium subarcticum]|uniref:Iron complex transport system permease protein n=1 Tax=Luteimicrobium subarcticum TaxID=620910 RepID=A0A2M8WQS7_9MICO|nr:iron complex transport system permease protein [Luteimicrobium subarcticum]